MNSQLEFVFYKRMKEEEEEKRCSEPARKAVLDSKIILKLEFLNLLEILEC